jgi:hypothetical protein
MSCVCRECDRGDICIYEQLSSAEERAVAAEKLALEIGGQRDLAEDFINRALPILQRYASGNPRFGYTRSDGHQKWQDPYGVHALLAEIRAQREQAKETQI